MKRLFVTIWALSFGGVLAAEPTSHEVGCGVFAPDAAWCWFSDPRATSRGGRTFAGWITADGTIQIGARDATTGYMQIVSIAEKFEVDDHDNPALLFLPDGRLAVFYSKHTVGDMHFRITRKSGDIGEWEPDRTLGFGHPGGSIGVTYANPVILAEESNALYVFWRGSDFKPNFAISRDLGKTWAAPRTLIRRPGAAADNRPYMKVWSDGKRRINFAFTDGHPRNEPANSIYFLRFEKGAFYKADGTRIGGMEDLPLDPSKCDRVYDGATAGRAWVWDVAEWNNRPAIAYTRLPAETDHRYHYARWDGQAWKDSELTAAGGWFPQTRLGEIESEPHYSGGLVLDHGNAETVYLSRLVDGIFELEEWRSLDDGESWQSRALTRGSLKPNVRPFVVRGAKPGEPLLLWMSLSGQYHHYTDYRTSLLFLNKP